MIVRKLSKPGLNTCPILGLERKTRYITTAKFLPFLKNYSGDVESKKLIKANEIKTKWVSGKGEGETSQNYGFFYMPLRRQNCSSLGNEVCISKIYFFLSWEVHALSMLHQTNTIILTIYLNRLYI